MIGLIKCGDRIEQLRYGLVVLNRITGTIRILTSLCALAFNNRCNRKSLFRIAPRLAEVLTNEVLRDTEQPGLTGFIWAGNSSVPGGLEARLLEKVVRGMPIIAHTEQDESIQIITAMLERSLQPRGLCLRDSRGVRRVLPNTRTLAFARNLQYGPVQRRSLSRRSS